MANANPVPIPLLNANESEARLVSLHVQEGQPVSAGDLLCTLETTKSTTELEAESGGYVIGLRYAEGDLLTAGDILCYLADSPDWTPPPPEEKPEKTGRAAPANLRITQPALALARRHDLDLSQFPANALITENVVRALLEKAGQPATSEFDPSALIIYGGGGHGKALIDLVRAVGGYRIHGIIDDGLPPGQEIMEVAVLGGGEILAALYAQGIRQAVNAVGGIGGMHSRIRVFERIAQAGFECPALVHPTAFIEPSATLANGVQIFPHAYVGTEAALGFGVIANTGAIISHDCSIDDYANIAPGAILAGAVRVGAGALLGMGVTVNLSVAIGANARIGNGATIKADVPANAIVSAGSIFPKD